MNLDSRTPVVVGVGQAAERIDDANYRGMSAVEVAAGAARAALDDCGAAAAAAAIDTVAGVRQFEITGVINAPLGRSNNYPRSVANRIGANPPRAILEIVGGQGPQHLISELAAEIAAGRSEAALIFGSDTTSTLRHFAQASEGLAKPDFTETVDGDLEDRGQGMENLVSRYTVSHGLTSAPIQYALLENARRAGTGLGPTAYRRQMGELFAPFTKIAAKNPFAAAPVERTVDELITVTERNRMISEPYPRLMVARDQVNQGAAALLMSVEAARRLGVPEENWVYLHGHADVEEQSLLTRPDLGHSPAAVMAVREALAMAGIGIDDIATFDLYSCFPVPVFNICDGLGLATDDPRGLTMTGGLPFFGGAGNNYSMHAVAETVAQMRSAPGQFGLVSANGGILSKHSVGIYSSTPAEWKSDRSARLQAQVAGWPTEPVTEIADGDATIETYTVRRDGGRPTGIIIGRLVADDSRFLATSEDDEFITLLIEGEPLGRKVRVQSFDYGNRCSLR